MGENILFYLKYIQINIKLPTGWLTHKEDTVLTFFCVKHDNNVLKLKIEKQLVISDDFEVMCYISDNLLMSGKLGTPFSLEHVQHYINFLNSKEACKGGPSALNYPGIIYSLI